MAHGPIGEDVAEPTLNSEWVNRPHPKDPTANTLADKNYTASARLKDLALILYGGVRPLEGEAYLGMDPDLRRLPDVEARTSQIPGGREADLSVGWEDRLRAKTGIREGLGGTSAYEQVISKWGPGEAFWERAQQEGFPDLETDKFGGSLTLGPIRFSGEQQETTSTPIPLPFDKYFKNREMKERQRRAFIEGQYPVGSGILSGSVGREWEKSKLPQAIWEEEQREVDTPPRTSGEVNWTGKWGPAELMLLAQYARERGKKPRTNVGFELEKIFGPMKFSLQGSRSSRGGGGEGEKPSWRFLLGGSTKY